MKTIVFFNNKGGVGKTTLVYHLAHMFSRLGVNTLSIDLDPQANLTSAFFDENMLEYIWPENGESKSIVTALRPILKGLGDIVPAPVETISERLNLISGDLALSRFEDELSSHWAGCADGKEPSFRVESAFYRIAQTAAKSTGSQLALIDVGPNLGAINRSALLCADYLIMPLAADLFSLQGLRNLGPTVSRWRAEWQERRGKNPEPNLPLPSGEMTPAGYVIMQPAVRLDRPVKAYARWTQRIPDVYRERILQQPLLVNTDVADEHCLATLRNYMSLMPYAHDARKPMFDLKPADGALGGHLEAVNRCRDEFENLALAVAMACGIEVSETIGRKERERNNAS